MAKRAVISYLRAIHLMKDKHVFQVNKIEIDKLALSYGLATAPSVEFVNKKDKNDRV